MARGKSSRKKPAEKKPPLTHFLCLPLVTAASKPQLEASVKAFTDDVSPTGSNDDSSNGNESTKNQTHIHPKAIRPVGALHCTLGVMSLSKDQLEQAIETLNGIDVERLLASSAAPQKAAVEESSTASEKQDAPSSLKRPISPPSSGPPCRPLRVDLKGLVSMHAPQKTSILYTAPEDSSDRLYSFCLGVQDLFKQKGFLVPDDRQLKLHATIVNTIYAKGRKKRAPPSWHQKETAHQPQRNATVQDDTGIGSSATDPSGANDQGDRSQGHGPNANAPLKIDARAILEKYEGFLWAKDVVLDRIAICEMGAKKKFDGEGRLVGEEYTEAASVRLPT